jgi:septal ring factor EnvC (AmiA/AmiB activator)
MSDEELRKIMEFIIKRQESFSERVEQFSAKLQRMEELHEERIGQLERAAVNLYNTVEELSQSQRVLTVKMVELADAQAHTDQRLNALIDIIAQGRGGAPEV